CHILRFFSFLSLLYFFYFFLLTLPRPPISTLFPYTTLFRSLLEPVEVECFLSSEVVEWVVCVEPVAFGIDREVGNFCELGRKSRSEEHTSELQSRGHLVCRLLLEKKKKNKKNNI